MSLTITGPALGQSSLCAPVLRALPDWFGIEAATAQYIQDIETMPTLMAWMDSVAVGFLALNYHNDISAEIHVVGVRPQYHRQGIGRSLIEKAETILRQQGVLLFQVKTISADHPSEFYARTRYFYIAMGFHPLQVFPTLWGEYNPCLQLVKWLGG